MRKYFKRNINYQADGLSRKKWISEATRDMLFIFLAATTVRGILLALSFSQLESEKLLNIPGDSSSYVNAAVALLTGEGSFERTFFAFGPGYPVALAIEMKIFGILGIPLLIINSLLSSLTCVFIYAITKLFGFGRRVAFAAGVAATFSITAITLSAILLSDTTYFFLLALTLMLYLGGLESNNRIKIIISGAILSLAILTRSIGQMMPLALFILFMLSGLGETLKSKDGLNYYRSRWLSVALCLFLPILSINLWIERNQMVNSVPALSFTKVGAPARVASMTLQRLTGKPEVKFRSERVALYKDAVGKKTLSPSDIYTAHKLLVNETFRDHPCEMLRTYAIVDWENWNNISYLHRVVIPALNSVTIPIERMILDRKLNYLPILIALIGFLILIKQKRYRTVLSIATIYFYYALLIGFYAHQGSRYFLPAQVVEAALLGLVATSIWASVALQLKKLRAKMYA